MDKLKVYVFNKDWSKREITDYIDNISISGDLDSLSRSLDLSILNSKFNGNNIGKGTFDVGNYFYVLMNDKPIFRGICVDFSNTTDNITVSCLDYLFYLNKSKITKNFQNVSPESATRKILSELDVSAGDISNTGIRLDRIIKNKTASETIEELYFQVQKQNGKRYFLTIEDNLVCVKELGKIQASKKIAVGDNIIDGSLELRKSIGETVNKVKVYDEEGNLLATIEDNNLKEFGVLQENYEKEEDKDYNIVAKNMLKGVKYEFTVSVLGNMEYKAGNMAHVYVPQMQIDYPMYIISDSHNFNIATGTYETQLELTWENQLVNKGDSEDV
ncbi:MAG: XkdQ/YqbQ family protein [Sarcina sp.]